MILTLQGINLAMDRLVVVDPTEVRLHLEDHIDGSSSHTATVHLHSVLHTMPVAFKIQPMVASKYSVKPSLGMIPPLGGVNLEISLLPSSSSSRFFSVDGFEVKSVVVAGAGKSKEWFTPQKRVVYTDESLKVRIIGGIVLRDAIIRGAMEEARQVLESGTNPDTWNTQGLTALHLAIQSQRPDMVQLLLEFGARVDSKTMNADGHTPLHCAAMVGHTVILEMLLARGADPERADSSGWRPIHHAASSGSLEPLGVLSKICDVNAPIGDGRTALHLAAIGGNADSVQILAQSGADVSARTVDGKTALHLAATQGNNVAIAKLLIKCGADRGAVDWNGRTAYDEAVELGQESLFALLQVPGNVASPAPLGDDLEELLRNAAWSGDLRGVRRCLKRGAAVNACDRYGWTALHCAAFKGHAEIVKRLLESCQSKEEACAIDEQGYSALHCAVESGHREVVKILVGCEMIEINGVTREGLSALDMALALEHGGMVRTLVNAGARACVANLIIDE